MQMLGHNLRLGLAITVAATGIVVALILLGPSYAGSESKSNEDQTTPDVKTLHGSTLVAEACADCHGKNGVSVDSETPKLAG